MNVLTNKNMDKDKFTHMLASKQSYANGVGTAYMIGTKQECRIYQLQSGLRASTQIVPF